MSSKIDLMDEGLLNVLHAGGCQCDPPGSGEEFCTGHCVLRAEVERTGIGMRAWKIRAETAEAEVERLRAALQKINALPVDSAASCFDIAWIALGKP